MNDGSRDEAQARRAEALVLEGAIPDFAQPVEEHRTPQRVARLALIQPGVAALAQCRIG